MTVPCRHLYSLPMSATPAHPQDYWTTRTLLTWTTRRFEQAGLEFARRQAEMLLSHVLNYPDRLRLYLEMDRPATPEEKATFRALVQRALTHEPIDYLIGKAPFFGLTLKVTPATLVPRPATETLVEFVLETEKAKGAQAEGHILRLCDIGTGSGTIALTLAKFLPKAKNARITATDISQAALEVAKENARLLGVETQVSFLHGDLLAPLAGETFDFLLSNPPYIPDHEWEAVEKNVKDHEPVTALRGGTDGLSHLRPLIEQGGNFVKSGGWMALELASWHAEQAADLARQAGWLEVRILKDHENLPRILVGKRA